MDICIPWENNIHRWNTQKSKTIRRSSNYYTQNERETISERASGTGQYTIFTLVGYGKALMTEVRLVKRCMTIKYNTESYPKILLLNLSSSLLFLTNTNLVWRNKITVVPRCMANFSFISNLMVIAMPFLVQFLNYDLFYFRYFCFFFFALINSQIYCHFIIGRWFNANEQFHLNIYDFFSCYDIVLIFINSS